MTHAGSIPRGRLILGCLLGLAVAAALVVLIVPLIATQVTGGSQLRIRSDAMAPALLPGDWVLAEPLPPGQAPPRGAIVLYSDPNDQLGRQALRVMGLPGERIQVRGGALYVNGRRAEMERLDDRVVRKRRPGRWGRMPLCINDPVETSGECRQERWREILPDGTSNVVLNTRHKVGVAVLAGAGSGRSAGDNTKQIRIPNDHVFLIGDNRDSARDSRITRRGLVPQHEIRQRVWIIHTSLDRSARFPIPRWDRFFREIKR